MPIEGVTWRAEERFASRARFSLSAFIVKSHRSTCAAAALPWETHYRDSLANQPHPEAS